VKVDDLNRWKGNCSDRAPARIAVEPTKVRELVRCLRDCSLVEWNLDPAHRAPDRRSRKPYIIGILDAPGVGRWELQRH
jgi:hypothetical protein